MDTPTTLTVLGIGMALTLAAMLGDRARLRRPLGRLAHLPWHALLFVGLGTMLFMAAHLLTLSRA